MIVVQVARRKGTSIQDYVNEAIGTVDELGNPFSLITLRFIGGGIQKVTDNSKTRGFEDPIIKHDPKSGGFKITYRHKGSACWERPALGGAYRAQVPNTPYNLRVLARHYGEKRWLILEADVNAQVKAMWEKMREAMTPEERANDDQRVAGMHTARMDTLKKVPTEMPVEHERRALKEEQTALQKREAVVRQEEAALEQKKQAGIEEAVKAVIEDEGPKQYTQEELEGLKLYQLRKLCNELNVDHEGSDKIPTLVRKIIEHQNAKAPAMAEALDS